MMHRIALNLPLFSGFSLRGHLPVDAFTKMLRSQQATWQIARFVVHSTMNCDILCTIRAIFIQACIDDSVFWTIEDSRAMLIDW